MDEEKTKQLLDSFTTTRELFRTRIHEMESLLLHLKDCVRRLKEVYSAKCSGAFVNDDLLHRLKQEFVMLARRCPSVIDNLMFQYGRLMQVATQAHETVSKERLASYDHHAYMLTLSATEVHNQVIYFAEEANLIIYYLDIMNLHRAAEVNPYKVAEVNASSTLKINPYSASEMKPEAS